MSCTYHSISMNGVFQPSLPSVRILSTHRPRCASRVCVPSKQESSNGISRNRSRGPLLSTTTLSRNFAARHSRRSHVKALVAEDDVVRVASVGDMVALHFLCKDEDGGVLESSYAVDEPLSFEVGAGDIMGNKLFQGFDEAIRGLAVGQKTEVEASGGEWNKDLMFSVPIDHPEVTRLQGRYKNQGGLKDGLLIELANNSMAMVLEINDAEVKIDANNMLAGKKLFFELEVMAIETAPPR